MAGRKRTELEVEAGRRNAEQLTRLGSEVRAARRSRRLTQQALVLRHGRTAGYRTLVELPTKPAEPWRSIDVALADDRRRRLVIIECWNSIGDVGAAARTSNRKQADGEAIAAARWGDGQPVPQVGLVWVVRATARNRALVARYPEVFGARFPGSSRGWVETLTAGRDLPHQPGVVWSSVDGSRLFAWRRPAER